MVLYSQPGSQSAFWGFAHACKSSRKQSILVHCSRLSKSWLSAQTCPCELKVLCLAASWSGHLRRMCLMVWDCSPHGHTASCSGERWGNFPFRKWAAYLPVKVCPVANLISVEVSAWDALALVGWSSLDQVSLVLQPFLWAWRMGCNFLSGGKEHAVQ